METFLPTDQTGQMMRNPAVVRVRCPECFRLYSVSAAEISESRPRFACIQCETKFWLAFPESLEADEVIGFPLEWLESPQSFVQKDKDNGITQRDLESSNAPLASKDVLPSTESLPLQSKVLRQSPSKSWTLQQDFHCPKCGHSTALGSKECGSCGVVFAKLEIKSRWDTLPATKELKEHWENVIADYDDVKMHDLFIQEALAEGNLGFAAAKYRTILDAASDEMAEKQLKKMELLAAQTFSSSVPPVKKIKRTKVSFFMLVYLFCGLVIGAGFVFPVLRNLVGLGAALLFLTLALKFLFFRQGSSQFS